jgi:hypothetical protein
MGDGDEEIPATDAPPKLTLGQRLLTALPRLGTAATASTGPRQEAPADRSGARRGSGSAAASDEVDEVDEDGGDDGEPVDEGRDAPAREPGTRTRPTERVQAGTKAKGATGPSGMTREELAHRIKYVDDRERRIGMLMAPLGFAIGIVILVLALRLNPHQPLAKGQSSQATLITLAVGAIILSVVVFLAALSRRRALMGFALVFLGIPLNFPLLLPFWFVGGWLVFRSLKWQRELAALNRGQSGGAGGARGGGARTATGRGARQDPRARGREAAAARAARKQPAPKGPAPSKRYTPPKPTRPRPPASPSS